MSGATTRLTPGQTELDGLLDRNRLRFPDPLEHEFRADWGRRWLITNRAAWAGGLVLWTLFGILDRWAAQESFRTIWFLRFGLGCGVLLTLIALTFTPIYPRIMQPASALVVFLAGVIVTIMELTVGPTEYAYGLYMFGIALVAFFGYAAPRLRFWYATAAGLGMTLVSFSIGIDHQVWRTSHAKLTFVVIEAFLLAANGVGMLACYFIESGLRRNYLQQLSLEQERARSDVLLLNILPGPVAERLKRGADVVEGFDEVSILFADIVDFTPFAAGLEPRDVVAFLNDVFSRFDRLAESHDLEKIKTIGDEYMAVAGVPLPCADHAERVAEMALGMREEVLRVGEQRGHLVRLRIGLNCGPVVAGVIGLRKFSYDLWGDAVNTASRMQSHGVPGKIQVTDAIRDRLCERYLFEGPTTLEVKGKGSMQTWFLVGRLGQRAIPS